jgi:sialidase-1
MRVLSLLLLVPIHLFSQPVAKVLETKVISQQPELYHGWSTLAQQADGKLWVTWSGGREGHVCPFGQVCAMTSNDGGKTWTFPRVLLDGAIDDRDSGVLETAKGTLLVTTFTSLAYLDSFKKMSVMAELGKEGWKNKSMGPEQFARWKAAHERLNDDARKAELGEWLIRSTDGGKTWSTRLPTVVNSPHGPTQLKDGRLLYAGKQLWTEDRRVGVAVSEDDGASWKWLADIPSRPGDGAENGYHELHMVEAANGTLIAHIRNHNAVNKGETLQTESTDGGRTWSVPHSIGVWGLPSHLLRLKNGQLLMSYGHRRKPYGNQARLSKDHGVTWSEPVTISADGIGGDLGYPSTVELADGSFVTVWYETMSKTSKAVLRQAHWKLVEG